MPLVCWIRRWDWQGNRDTVIGLSRHCKKKLTQKREYGNCLIKKTFSSFFRQLWQRKQKNHIKKRQDEVHMTVVSLTTELTLLAEEKARLIFLQRFLVLYRVSILYYWNSCILWFLFPMIRIISCLIRWFLMKHAQWLFRWLQTEILFHMRNLMHLIKCLCFFHVLLWFIVFIFLLLGYFFIFLPLQASL